jgi:hypothetical protein
MAWPAPAARTRRDLSREAQRAHDEEDEHDGSADRRDDEGQRQDERMGPSSSGGRDARCRRAASRSWSARGCRAAPGGRTARGGRAAPGGRTARRPLAEPARVMRGRRPRPGPRPPRMTESPAAERKAPCERRRRRGAGRTRACRERPRRGRAQSRCDDQDRQDESDERAGAATQRDSGTGAPGRRHMIVTGVPIGSRWPSARIAALRSRMQPWEIRPGIRPGSSVPWMPMNPPAGQSVS